MFQFNDTRYNRQEIMPEWGSRQNLLNAARVAVIGAGGVKSTLLMALTAAGVGTLRIIDFDRVELSNLNRQTLYSTLDIGRYKVEAACEKLTALNPGIAIDPIIDELTLTNADTLLESFDFIVEGGRSPWGRNVVNEYCLRTKKPFVHASAQFSYGYVFSVIPTEETACFVCFFPTEYQRQESTGAVPVNVLSVQLAGTLGAAEVLKWFLGYKDKLIVNRRLCFSSLLLSGKFELFFQSRRNDCPICSKYYESQ